MKDFLSWTKHRKDAFWKKKKRFDLLLIKTFRRYCMFCLPLMLLLIWLHLLVFSYYVHKETQLMAPNTLLVNSVVRYPYPMLQSVLGEASKSQSVLQAQYVADRIFAKAAVILDNDSQVVLFSKNPNLRFSMASTTKIMTTLVALDYFKLDDVLTIKTTAVEGVVVGFRKGERVRFEDLLYAMLLPSGNDAALAIAGNYTGGIAAFVEKMNKKAIMLHLANTHFADSTGLEDDGDYTTALDLARLSSLAMKHDIIAKIVGTKHKVITTIDGNIYSLSNLNKLLDTYGVNGVKTGFTYDAQGVLATSKMEGGHRLIIVVMKSKDRFLDTIRLLELVDGKIAYLQF